MYLRVATQHEIPEGQIKGVEVDGKEIVLARVNGEVYGIDGICNHGLAYLADGELDGYDIVCPLHSGCFDIRTGAATRRPCMKPIQSYPIRIEGDDVLIDLSEADQFQEPAARGLMP